eukprot:CAMPEP_0202728620 /NCGR_PEP_ID=MMETSP1385-20130828/185717_1 /ASSEMBLY_ACC=CAM_ASM_000861 /TAXON_ID=933848 /ORGANISM="Elphidium margaritaceum" /LENGTH=1142 /DNA_ID=CAMNT_0049394871 /DNA_START=52 /DNA_END=3481 /DNA_ORIENTATION=+
MAESKQSEPVLAGKVIILDGPPASGKGSVAQLLCERFKCVHISTGDIFREHVQKKTELGHQLQKYLDMRSFAPDELVVNHVLDVLSQPRVKRNGCILDGFPRTPQQYAALKAAANVDIECIITLQCPDQVLLQRAKGRRLDARTGKIYHVEYVLPPSAAVLVKRAQDENIQSRLDVYRAQHRRFKFDGMHCVKVNANKPIKEVQADTMRIMEQIVASNTSNASAQIGRGVVAEVKPGDCTICLDQPAEYAIIPCGHQCGCRVCLFQLKQSNASCPICRGRIERVQKVFATHNVVIHEPKPAISAIHGAPARQQINDVEQQIFGGGGQQAAAAAQNNDAEAWPEDAADDDDEKQANVDCGVSVRIAPARRVNDNDNVYEVVLQITGDNERGRCPVDICAVLDVSGSMCSSAAVQEDDGSVKNDDGLSVLDLVKHSVNAVIHSLDKNDRLSIVAFSSAATTKHALSYMTANGRKNATRALQALQPGGQTNLWEGLRVGMESLRTRQQEGRSSVLMLLTDGRPTMIPPKGHVHELQNYVDTTQFAVQINTFGFGYDLDSELLHSLAVHGNGTFSFIPDARIVGTTFVNSVANVLTTISANSKLHLTAMNGARFVDRVYGAHEANEESWGRLVQIGPVLAGNTRYVCCPMMIPPSQAQAQAGAHEVNEESWGRLVQIGPVLAGNTRYVCCPMMIPPSQAQAQAAPYLECVLSLEVLGVKGKWQKVTLHAKKTAVANDFLAGALTAKAVTIGLDACALAVKNKGNAAMKLLKSVRDEIEAEAKSAKNEETDDFNQLTANSRMVALDADVGGRLSKAFRDKPDLIVGASIMCGRYCKNEETDDFNQLTANSRMVALDADVGGRLSKAFRGQTRFDRWGKHYVRALLRAHQLNVCTNFMDPGLQVNGGALFRELRSKGDEAFINLPPPTPSRRTGPSKSALQHNVRRQPQQQQQQQRRAPVQRPPSPPPVDMNDYYAGSGGGCFAGECTVRMMDGSRQKVSEVAVADMVQVSGGEFARVLMVVQLKRDPRRRMIALPGGLVITGGHPVRRDGVWCVPREQADARAVAGCDTVFAFVLEHNHVLMVNDTECITWAHGMSSHDGDNDAVLGRHSFFASAEIIGALQRRMKRQQLLVNDDDRLKQVVAVYSV